MQTEVQIPDALVPQELDVVRSLFREYAAELNVDLCFQGFSQELASLPGRYSKPDGGIWLAVRDDCVGGCIALRRIDGARCEMKRLFVKPGFRGTGAGRRLTEHALTVARQIGYRSICLDTLPSMGTAIALYRSLGFKEIDAYCHNPVAGALFFERKL